MHLLFSAEEDDAALEEELALSWPEAVARRERRGVFSFEHGDLENSAATSLVFARQLAANATPIAAASVRSWAEQTSEAMLGKLADDQAWRMHVVPHYDSPANTTAGRRRCQLIDAAIQSELKARCRRLWRQRCDASTPWTTRDSFVQVMLASPGEGWLSLAPAPLPLVLRRMVWPFPKGEIPVASDPVPPSRAFTKLIEAEARSGACIGPGEHCVDLGASPGSWTYVALARGANVTAVDRAPLRADLMRHADLRFVRGDAFTFVPDQPVDWLLCDVIAAPERSIDLLLSWLRRGLTRRFVVTIKFKGRRDYAQLDRLKSELARLTADWFVIRLCANKNEACAFGAAR
jgi:23S rRNA (cytidine2498-2'-O)-methyltransferase